MKRLFSILLMSVLIICSMSPAVSAFAESAPLSVNYNDCKYTVMQIAPQVYGQESSAYKNVIESDLDAGAMGWSGPFTFDTIEMAIEYTPASLEIAYGITTDYTTLKDLIFRVATGGSGSTTLKPGYGTYYVIVANKSDTKMHFRLEFTPTAELK